VDRDGYIITIVYIDIFSVRKNEIKIKRSEMRKSYFPLWQNDKLWCTYYTISLILK